MIAAGSAHAQVSGSGFIPAINFALKAAQEFVRSCDAKGYSIGATVVDVAKISQVVLRGNLYEGFRLSQGAHDRHHGAHLPCRHDEPVL